MAGGGTGMMSRFAARLRLALASSVPRWGDAAERRLRIAARRGEADQLRDPAERFYASLYLDRIMHALPAGSGLRILDAGCQAGRLAIPLARLGHRVTGIDRSAEWIELCRRHCAEEGVAVDLILGDMREVVGRFERESYDAVLCIEVLYTMRQPQEQLAALARLLKPGGTLITSHRTRHYMLTTLARYHRLADMAVVAHGSEGEIFGGQYYNWFAEDELRCFYAQAGLRIVSIDGVGTVSGTGVDGMAVVLDPGELDETGRDALLAIERACAFRYRDVARYQLVIAVPDPRGYA